MKLVKRFVLVMLCLSLPFIVTGQIAQRATKERASQLTSAVEQVIRDKEKNWSLLRTHSAGSSSSQRWKSGGRELEVRIFVYASPEEASRKLASHGVFSVALSQKMDGFGDEAHFISSRYFSWVGVRKGTLVAEVQGPAQELDLTKRFAQHALAQLERD